MGPHFTDDELRNHAPNVCPAIVVWRKVRNARNSSDNRGNMRYPLIITFKVVARKITFDRISCKESKLTELQLLLLGRIPSEAFWSRDGNALLSAIDNITEEMMDAKSKRYVKAMVKDAAAFNRDFSRMPDLPDKKMGMLSTSHVLDILLDDRNHKWTEGVFSIVTEHAIAETKHSKPGTSIFSIFPKELVLGICEDLLKGVDAEKLVEAENIIAGQERQYHRFTVTGPWRF